jgi:hypothetical protein
MDADWEVEVGGEAPVIEALWPGFVDLRAHPERVGDVAEAAACAPLAQLLLALNGDGSNVWTAKCDLWTPAKPGLTMGQLVALMKNVDGEEAALACYVDVLPREGMVFARWEQAEAVCREWVGRLGSVDLDASAAELIVRQAIAGEAEGFGVTAYLSAGGDGWEACSESFAATLRAFARAMAPAL